MQASQHWDDVYASKGSDNVSWFQAHAERSLNLIDELGIDFDAPVVDVGCGGGTLIDDLMHAGCTDLTALDISAAALSLAKARLGERGALVRWLHSDVLAADLRSRHFALWHDRAVFHFLLLPEQRQAYVAKAAASVRPGGYLIVAAFAEDGPEQCSGLPVVRYTAGRLAQQFAPHFTLRRHELEAHPTPFGSVQQFVYCLLQRL